MSTVSELENTVAHLPAADLVQLGRCFAELRQQRWDDQMSRDAASGKLDFLSADLDGLFVATGGCGRSEC